MMGEDAEGPGMADRTRVLVPVAVLEGETVGQGIVDLLAGESVVLLGYHVIPEQTAPEQARTSFEERARAKLDDVQEAFEDADADVDSRLVFTHDRAQTFERLARDTDCDALLWLNPTMAVEDVLVTLSSGVDAERVGRFAARLADDTDIDVHLLGINEGADELVASARAALEAAGIDPARVSDEHVTTDRPVQQIIETGAGFDAIVMGETSASLSELVLGDVEERIAEASIGPVFEVLRED